ncbi:MAG: protein translocase subunit SecD [Candidatus Omnitrophica bacterium]|nr:protein translocase subunit SecD [Candidatus Omnitrophota bacterium]
MPKSLRIKLILVILFVLFCSWVIYPLNEKINLGLDLQGGIFLTLRVDMSKLPTDVKADLRTDIVERTIEIIRKRVDQFGVKEPIISRQGADRIIVQLPGVTDRIRARKLIGKTAQLEFRLVSDDEDKLTQALGNEVVAGYELKYDKEQKPLLIEKTAVMTGESLAHAIVDRDQYGRPSIKLEFTKEGARMFSNITGANVGRRLAIVLDAEVYSAPVINERISGGNAEITGSFTVEQANDLSTVLRTGALPAPIEFAEERTVGPLLGADSIKSGVTATLIGSIGVFIFMAVYYLVGGVLANIALALNILIVLAALVILRATLTLPGIAGIGLTIGMAVDANVLINERIREELSLGKSTRTAINNGYSRAFPAILDSNTTTIIAAFLLVWFGSGPIRGFGLTLIIGLLASMFSAIVVTRLMIDVLTLKYKNLSLKMLQFIPSTKMDFIKIRKFFFIISVVFILIGMFFFKQRGDENYGIDFSGGAMQEFKFEKPVEVDQLRQAMDDIGLASALIQQDKKEPEIVLIRTEEDSADKIMAAFEEKFPSNKADVLSVESVGPVVGELLKKNALIALTLSLLAICVYVWVRFRDFTYGLAGVVSLFHDVIVAIAVCAIMKKPIDLLIVTALMTIAGYSINDTIVTYDRIRENIRLMRKTSFKDIINLSINQTLGRTIWTSFTTLCVTVSLCFFGGKVLHDFAFILLVGLISGVYSTIFIASPLLYSWEKRYE